MSKIQGTKIWTKRGRKKLKTGITHCQKHCALRTLPKYNILQPPPPLPDHHKSMYRHYRATSVNKVLRTFFFSEAKLAHRTSRSKIYCKNIEGSHSGAHADSSSLGKLCAS